MSPDAEPRPLIGVASWLERARWQIMEQDVVLLEASFVRKLDACGADVVVLPPQASLPWIASELDGIVLAGGRDVGAGYYGAQASSAAQPELRARDESELALARLALALDIPLLAVCRGCQVMNVAAGGTLVAHVPDRYAGVVHTRFDDAGPFMFAEHAVATEDELLRGVLGTRFDVLSSHHQAVDQLGDGIEAAAHSDDGLVEAIVATGNAFALGVQWHPEARDDSRLFHALVAAAREHATRAVSGASDAGPA